MSDARWDESLALAFHDAIDGDFLVDAGGEDHAVGISVVRVSEVVRWATKAVLASDWLAQHVERALAAERERVLQEAADEYLRLLRDDSVPFAEIRDVDAWLRDRAAIARGNPHTPTEEEA